jgi:subtilisin family serine protease
MAMTTPGNASSGEVEEQSPGADAPERADVSLDSADLVDVNDVIDIFIQMDEAAVTEFVAEAQRLRRPEPTAGQRRAQADRVEAQHDRIRPALDKMGVDEQSSLKVGANGLRVKAAIADIPDLAGLPGVESVAPVVLHEPTNDTSVPWIGAPDAWEALGFTGENIIISVIDTGIDYTHASFGGAGDPADYEFIAEDTTVIPEVDGEPVFPTAKVINGFDFVGVDYDASTPGLDIPEPDPNPIDVFGHGSHVAGSAAGVEVLDENGELSVGSGVAPGALLYSAKVFGDVAGSTAVTADAIEWSLDPLGDGSMIGQAHVINMSLGNVFGQQGDPTAIASNNAAAVGTVVVASAGNSGQTASYNGGTPGAATDVIGVAASVDDGHFVLGLEVLEPAAVAGTYEAAESGTSLPLSVHGPLTGELVAADPLIACEADGVPLINNPEELAGKIALVQRGVCAFTLKHQAVQDAGATGIVVFNNAPGDPIVMGGDPTGITIPGVMISQGDGQLLLDQLNLGETVSLTMSEDIVIPKPELADTLADFTSRGPGNTSNFKPDVAAPGFGIMSAGVGSGDQPRSSSGTSMASPHVAGIAALLAGQHGLQDIDDVDEKAATVQKIKSLIMNSTVDTAETYPLTLQGTGVVRADRAVDLDAYTSPAGLSFGRVNPTGPTTLTETVTVNNLADEAQTFDISFTPNEVVSGAQITHDDSVSVPAGGSATFDVTLTLDPAAMPVDAGGFSQTELDGWVNLADSDTSLRAGVLAVVDPASAVDVSAVAKEVGETSIDLDVANDSLTTGLSSGYTLVGQGDVTGGVFQAVGVRTFDIGATPVVQFGVATDGWESLSSLETQVLIDVDEDGVDDFALVAADLNFLQGLTDPIGQVVTALFNLSTGAGSLEWFVDGDYNNEVQGLIVDRAGDFGFLEDGNTDFDYTALQFFDETLLGVQEGSIDLADGVDGSDNPDLSVPAGATGALSFPLADEREMLWLHPGNGAGAQFQTVTLDALCDETITGTHLGALAISDGTTCLDGSFVLGKVTVGDGAGLASDGARVLGPVSSDGATIVWLDGTTFVGPVTVARSTDRVEITDNRIVGPVKVRDNTTGETPIVVGGNFILGGLTCTGNEPAPVDGGDPNLIIGRERGQC